MESLLRKLVLSPIISFISNMISMNIIIFIIYLYVGSINYFNNAFLYFLMYFLPFFFIFSIIYIFYSNFYIPLLISVVAIILCSFELLYFFKNHTNSGQNQYLIRYFILQYLTYNLVVSIFRNIKKLTTDN